MANIDLAFPADAAAAGSERKRLPLLLLAPADLPTGGSDGMGTKPADD